MSTVYLDGLDEFRRNINSIDKGLGKELGQHNKTIGKEVVRLSERRRNQMASRFPSYRSRYVKIKASASQRQVQVTIPGAPEQGIRRHPVYGRWMNQADFRRRVWPKERKSGWVVRPTVEEEHDLIAGLYVEVITDFARGVLER